MTRKILLLISLLTFTNTAFADWVGGIGYYQLNFEEEDISVGGAGFTIGYQFDSSTSIFSLTPEIRVGIGIGDDTVDTTLGVVDIEVDTYYGINIRGQWDFSNGTYLFVAPSYTNLEVEAPIRGSGGLGISTDGWEFGGGVGAGFSFTETISAELSYEKFDSLEAIGLGLRFKF